MNVFDEIETNIRKTTCFYGFESSMRELMTDIRQAVASDLRRRATQLIDNNADLNMIGLLESIADAYKEGE